MVSKRKAYQKFKDGGRVLHDGAVLGTPAPPDDVPKADHAADVLTEQPVSDAFQRQIDSLRNAEQAQRRAEQVRHQPLTVEQTIDRMQLPDPIKTWVKDHPEYVTDARKNSLIQKLHWDIVEDEGHAPYSAPYIASMERHLGLSDAAEIRDLEKAYQAGDVKAQAEITKRIGNTLRDDDAGRGRIVSAPVTRGDSGGGSYAADRPGRVTLSPAQVEAAKIAGVDLKTYAEQVLKL